MVREFAYVHETAEILLLSGKNIKCCSTVSLSKTTSTNPNHQNYLKKPLLHGLNLKKSLIKNYTTLFRVESGHHSNQTQLSSTKSNKSPTWRLVQSPTSTAILQKQSIILTTHPPLLKLEDQLKLHTASASQ